MKPVGPALVQVPAGSLIVSQEAAPDDTRVLASRWLVPTLRAVALMIAVVHTMVAVGYQSMSEDGINYLDIGSAYFGGDWATALNSVWSPLYPLILGVVVHVVQPSVWWEFPAVQLTNLAIFVGALICFEFFWRELTVSYYHSAHIARPAVLLPPGAWMTLGYSLFIWASLVLIAIWRVTPDMLVAACVYLAAGLLCRQARMGTTRGAALLGLVLGFGYLAKAALFPLGVCVLLLSTLVRPATSSALRGLGVAVMAWAAVAGPYIVALSAATGHATVGEVGRFTYMKHVNGLRYPEWSDSLERVSGTPSHPPRLIFTEPAVHEFGEPIAGTYPLAFNPGYWTRGLTPRIDLSQQFRAIVGNMAFYFDLFARIQGAFSAIALLLLILSWRRMSAVPNRTLPLVLGLWAVCAFGLYALVYAEGRYIAPFVVLFWAGLLTSVRLPPGREYRTLIRPAAVLLCLAIWVDMGAVHLNVAAGLFGLPTSPPAELSAVESTGRRLSSGRVLSHPAIAEGLAQAGISSGDRIAFAGDSWTAFWARLLRVRIVAEIRTREDRELLWTMPPARQEDLFGRLAAHRIVAVIAEKPPGEALVTGWEPVGDTGYVLRRLHGQRHSQLRAGRVGDFGD